MDLTGHGSNPDFQRRLTRVADRAGKLAAQPAPVRRASAGNQRRRRAWHVVANAVVAALGPSGELRVRDIHAAVEALLGETVPPSTVKSCLTRGEGMQFRRLARGRYRLLDSS
jgi:hypothetical protein